MLWVNVYSSPPPLQLLLAPPSPAGHTRLRHFPTPANFGDKKACWILHWQAYSTKTSLFVDEPKGAKPTSPKGQSRGHRINIVSCIAQCRNTRQWNSIKALHNLIKRPIGKPLHLHSVSKIIATL